MVADSKKEKKGEKTTKAAERLAAEKLKKPVVPFDRTPVYFSGRTGVRVVVLKDTLNRFRFVGEGSRAILNEVTENWVASVWS